jgi:hypothetical protein
VRRATYLFVYFLPFVDRLQQPSRVWSPPSCERTHPGQCAEPRFRASIRQYLRLIKPNDDAQTDGQMNEQPIAAAAAAEADAGSDRLMYGSLHY